MRPERTAAARAAARAADTPCGCTSVGIDGAAMLTVAVGAWGTDRVTAVPTVVLDARLVAGGGGAATPAEAILSIGEDRLWLSRPLPLLPLRLLRWLREPEWLRSRRERSRLRLRP